MRNKHIKTMTSLTGATCNKESLPLQTASAVNEMYGNEAPPVGRNTTFMAGSNRLFKRQQEMIHLQTQLMEKSETRLQKSKALPLNPLIFKTMSNLEEKGHHNQSQKDSASTVILTKIRTSKKDLHRKDSTILR